MSMERPQTSGEEIGNTVSHVIGSHLGAAMMALLVWQAVNSGTAVAWKVTSGSIFGASIILLYAVSSAYHAVDYGPAKRVLQKLDHMAIYFLIAGSYTPFCLVLLRPDYPLLAWTIFGVEWAATIVGVVFKIWTTGRFKTISTIAYVVMGWLAILAIVPLIRTLHGMGTMWLMVGGASYTLGSVAFVLDRLRYMHMVWHLFVLAGTICHFFCILWHVM